MAAEGLLSICRIPRHLMPKGFWPQALLPTSRAAAKCLGLTSGAAGCAWRAAPARAAGVTILEGASDVDLRAADAAVLPSMAAACSAALPLPVLVPPLLEGC